MTNLANSTGILAGQPGAPRRILFTVRHSFGN
jgi:hypothetical protein